MTVRPTLWNTLCALVLLACASVFAMSANAQESVPVRSWQHSDFARLVFDWSSPVEYQASVSGQVLTVSFSRALQSDLSGLSQRLPAYVTAAAVGADGQSIVLQLTAPMTVGDFTNENSIVIDLRVDPNAAPNAAPAPQRQQAQAPPQPPAQTVSAQAPAGAVSLGIRVGEHPDYTRIVFDWPEQPGYEVNRNGRAVTISFGRAADINVAAFADQLPAGITVAAVIPSEAGTQITLAVPDGVEVSHFPLEARVVVDIQGDAATRNAPAQPLPAELIPTPPEQVAAAPPAPEPEPAPQVEQTPEAVPEPEAEEAAAPEVPESTPEQVAQQQDQALADAIADGTIEFRRGLATELDTGPSDPAAQTEDAATREPVPAPETQNVAQPQPEAPAAAQEPEPTEQAASETAASGPPLVTYNFQWSQDVGAAVFRRAENIWIIFDESAPIDLTPLRTEGAPIIERLDQLPIGNATVLRLSVPDSEINASTRREGFNWVVDFRRAPQRPLAQVPILADVTSEVGPHLIFPSDTPGAALNLPDPGIGDTLRIATFLDSGVGMEGLRRYPEFELLPTAQGIAMVRISDNVLLDRNFDGFMISAPDGLAINAISPEAPVSSGPILSARRLFDLAGWMRGESSEFKKLHETVFRSLAEVPDDRLNAARLDYAGFLMAHDRSREALGVLRVVQRDDEQLMARPENLALMAAANILANRPEEALQLLNDPRLDGFAESAIWRGAALAAQGEYLDAHTAFGPGDSLLSRYPFPLRARLGLLRIETLFANRDVRAAESWISNLEQERGSLTRGQQAELDYHRGRLAVAQTDFDLGEEIFEEVIKSGDRKFAYRAELALVTLGLRQGFMDQDEALERMERLRYAWRGDRSELHLLRRLGELYLEQPDYFEGLGVYRTAVQYFPDDPVADDLAGEMVEVFGQLFLEGGADDLAPLRAIALYEEFSELTPAGEVGDRVIENIADRLAAIDLLPEAAEKLEGLLADEDRIPPGEERVRLSSKLALLYLLDQKPDQAERALGLGRQGLELNDFGIDPDLLADRDRLLARVRYQQSEYEDAIKELAGDVSLEADLLRRDIYRTTQNWQEAAKVLQRLAGNPPDDPADGVDGERARFVINWAVALYQNNDTAGLRDLIDLWGPAMSNSPVAGVFDYVSDLEGAPSGSNVLETVNQLIGADRFDAFLTGYRERLFAPPPPPSAQVSATSF